MDWDPTQRRVIAVLIEKEFTTPERYPLTLNALISGCNQKSNRHPEMYLQDFEVEGCLRSLIVEGWVAEVRDGGRVSKWKHRSRDRLEVSEAGLGILCELLLRGPQSRGELRTRCARLVPALNEDVLDATLNELSGAASPLIEKLPRRAGERVERWKQTLAAEAPEEDEDAMERASSRPEEPSSPASATERADLEQRIAALEAEVRELRELILGADAESCPGEDPVD